jgi:hypothetical protein
LFTGFSRNEIRENPLREKCLEYIDVLIDGRYEEEYKTEDSLRGSLNQEFYFFSNKISKEELFFDQEIELSLESDKIVMTGFPNISRKVLKDLGVILK